MLSLKALGVSSRSKGKGKALHLVYRGGCALCPVSFQPSLVAVSTPQGDGPKFSTVQTKHFWWSWKEFK